VTVANDMHAVRLALSIGAALALVLSGCVQSKHVSDALTFHARRVGQR
jgi:hypothetical protein